MKRFARFAAAWLGTCVGILISMAAGAQEKAPEKPKPEIKSASALGTAKGKTLSLLVFGENLSPQNALFETKGSSGSPGATVKIVGPVEKTTSDEEKKRASQRVRLEIAVPADCISGVYNLVLVHPDTVQATVPLAVWEGAESEVEIKRPNATFAQAMPLQGGFVAVTGALTNGDSPDVYRFEAAAGETWRLSVLAGRAGSAADILLRLRDEKHRPLALSGGDEKQDRDLSFFVPKTGVYYIEVSDAEGRAGQTFGYRLTLRRQTPEAIKTPH